MRQNKLLEIVRHDLRILAFPAEKAFFDAVGLWWALFEVSLHVCDDGNQLIVQALQEFADCLFVAFESVHFLKQEL